MGIPEILMWLIFGAIIGFVLQNILFELFAGPELRFKIKYYRKKLGKRIRNPHVKTVLTTKTDDLIDKNLDLNEIRELIKNELKNKGFEVEPRGEDLKFNFTTGKTEINADVMFAPEVVEEGKVITSEVEVNLTASCGYNNFEGYILDLKKGAEMIEKCLRKVIKDVEFKGGNLTCELKNLYELTGILSGLELSSLAAKIGNRYSIDLFKNRIITYGDIDQNVTSILRKIITVYL